MPPPSGCGSWASSNPAPGHARQENVSNRSTRARESYSSSMPMRKSSCSGSPASRLSRRGPSSLSQSCVFSTRAAGRTVRCDPRDDRVRVPSPRRFPRQQAERPGHTADGRRESAQPWGGQTVKGEWGPIEPGGKTRAGQKQGQDRQHDQEQQQQGQQQQVSHSQQQQQSGSQQARVQTGAHRALPTGRGSIPSLSCTLSRHSPSGWRCSCTAPRYPPGLPRPAAAVSGRGR